MPDELTYHHSRPLERVAYGTVTAKARSRSARPGSGDGRDPNEEPFGRELEAAYRWLAGRVGLQPLFVAVGTGEEAIRSTGYADQRRRLVSAGSPRTYRRRGEFPSFVLFSWRLPPDGLVFLDFVTWHIVLDSVVEVGPREFAVEGCRTTRHA